MTFIVITQQVVGVGGFAKLLAYEARDPGFQPGFFTPISEIWYLLIPWHDMAERLLSDIKSSKGNPTL